MANSAESTFIRMALPARQEKTDKNTSGASTRGSFDRRNIASPGDHSTLNNRLTLCMPPPRCFFTLLCLSLQVTMRRLILILCLAVPAFAQDVDVAVRPDVVYVET